MPGLRLFMAMLIVCGGIGLPLSRILPASCQWRILAAPTLGMSVLAVAVNVAYRHGVPVFLAYSVALVLALAGIAVFGFDGLRRLRSGPWDPRSARLAAVVAVWGVVITGVLLAPAWTGGNQFTVFQGNQWDTFGYLNSAVVFAREPYQAVMAATEDDFLRNPLLAYAQNNLGIRPAVHLLYAAFGSIEVNEMHGAYYSFLVFFLAQFAPASLFVLKNLFPEGRLPALLIASSVFPLGFWGQYVLDINAWSQISSVPVLFLLFGLLVMAATNQTYDRRVQLRLAGAIAIAVSGSLFLYPESLVYHLVTLVPVVLVVIAMRLRGTRGGWATAFLPLLGLGGLMSGILYFDGTLALAYGQSQLGRVPWWHFFQGFFQGRDGWGVAPLGNAVDFVAAFFGLYFVTPAPVAQVWFSLVQRFLIGLLVVGLLAALAAGLQRRDGRAPFKAGRDGIHLRLAVFALCALALLAPAAWLAIREFYWQAGKGVSFAAPVFVTLLTLPLLFRASKWYGVAGNFAVGIFALVQIGAGPLRIEAARAPDGIHYALPYPSVQDEQLKRRLLWELDLLKPHLARAKGVLISRSNPWSENYLQVFLYAQGIPFFQMGPRDTYFGQGRKLGDGKPFFQPDTRIDVGDSTLRIQFADGSPSVIVASRRAVR